MMREEETKKVVLKVEQVVNMMKAGDPLAEYHFTSWRLETEEEQGSSSLRLGNSDKRVISKLTLLTTPELFIGTIPAIW